MSWVGLLQGCLHYFPLSKVAPVASGVGRSVAHACPWSCAWSGVHSVRVRGPVRGPEYSPCACLCLTCA